MVRLCKDTDPRWSWYHNCFIIFTTEVQVLVRNTNLWFCGSTSDATSQIEHFRSHRVSKLVCRLPCCCLGVNTNNVLSTGWTIRHIRINQGSPPYRTNDLASSYLATSSLIEFCNPTGSMHSRSKSSSHLLKRSTPLTSVCRLHSRPIFDSNL